MATRIPTLQLNQSVTDDFYEIKPFGRKATSYSTSSISLCSLNQMDENHFSAIIDSHNEPKASISTDHKDSVLTQYGYEKISKICDTLQGELYKSITNRGKEVVIKRADKSLYQQLITKHDGTMHCVEEDIVKEAQILYYLTVQNRPTAQYVVQYIDFIESENSYYLIVEYVQNNTNLKQFITRAHQYISCGKLQEKEYYKMIKYIFWQIFAVMKWLHVDVHCCHLDLKLENIMLENADFILNKLNGSVHIRSSISPKICGFGRSEVFKEKDTNNMYKCTKHYDLQYISPSLNYDARCVDILSLGMMLYHCHVGVSLTADYVFQTSKLKRYLLRSSCIHPKMIDLMCNILKTDQLIMDILKHRCFKRYYQKYKKRITEKSKSQKMRLIEQREVLRSFPYYQYHKKVSFV